MSDIQTIEEKLEQLKVEWAKFERGNKSAGTRARKVLRDIAAVCKELRQQVQQIKNRESSAE